MSKSTWKRAGVALTAAGLVAGLAGCNDGGDKTGAKAGGGLGDVTQVLTAAYEKTSAAKAAKIKMTIEMSGMGAESGTTTLTGVQGWDPGLMDVTMSGPMLGAGEAGMPDKIRMLMLDGAMYMDMGAEQAAQMDGKRWIKMDFGAMAEASGDKALQKQLSGSMESMNQDPAQQIALLLKSPNLKHVGPEKVAGGDAEHYKGFLSIADMLKANKAYDELISEKDRKALTEATKKAGIKGYDTDVWINSDGYPVKMVVGMEAPEGSMKLTADYSDYGTKADVVAPPAGETVDFMKMMQDMAEAGAEG
ncbi:hypothetical protein [Streptomyces sp. NPDC058486]|uniref:hypothetical protein n=1 Tax=unclassified Streptomyces TaxID=2593676 RepID=UPI00364E4B0E